MDVPNVKREEYQLVNVDDGFLNLMTNDGDTKDDVKVPDGDLGEQIQSAFDDGKDLMVTIVSAWVRSTASRSRTLPRASKCFALHRIAASQNQLRSLLPCIAACFLASAL